MRGNVRWQIALAAAIVGIGLLGASAWLIAPATSAVWKSARTTQSEPIATDVPAATDEPDALHRFRDERDRARRNEIAQLRALVEEASTDEIVRARAGERLIEESAHMRLEAILEGVLRGKGFVDPLATVGENSVNILLRADALTRDMSAMILELALRETGQSAENVKIIPIA